MVLWVMLGFWCPALHRSSSRLVKALKFQKWPCQGHVWHSSTSSLAIPLTHIGTCLDMSGEFSNRSEHVWNMPWTCLSDHAWTCLENKEIRSILEYGAIVFHHGLTLSLSNLIECSEKFCQNVVKLCWSGFILDGRINFLLYWTNEPKESNPLWNLH